MKLPLVYAVTATLLLVGCVASGSARYSAHVTTPELVYINSDVRVVADYDEPIFYASNFYWRYDDGVWYRSPRYTSGWVRIEVVPVAIRRIERPTAYIRYRAGARATTARTPTPAPQPSRDERRDLKDERKEIKEEQKEERKEQKEQQKEERKEQKEQQKEERKEQKADQKDSKKHGRSGH